MRKTSSEGATVINNVTVGNILDSVGTAKRQHDTVLQYVMNGSWGGRKVCSRLECVARVCNNGPFCLPFVSCCDLLRVFWCLPSHYY